MSNDKTAARKRAIKEFAIGAAVAAAGGIATYVSYSSARPGGTYTVYTGFIALGVVYAIKGLIGLVFPKAFADKNKPTSTAPKDAEAVVEAEVSEENDEA